MTSRVPPSMEAFVWVWLPGEVEQVVAGKLTADGDSIFFNYGRSYLEREDAIPLYDVELPLEAGILPLPAGLTMPGCIRDGSPDAWGRRVLLNRILGERGRDADPAHLDELTYLLHSGSDRIGALDFQPSPTEYIPRSPVGASLEELAAAAEKVEKGIPLSRELNEPLQHGSSIGGARPKASIEGHGKKYIAKFSASNDLYSVVKAEYIAMRLAEMCGLSVAQVELTTALNKDVLLIERFDRQFTEAGWQRHMMLSALTLLGLDEMMARYASYQDLAELVRRKFTGSQETLRELFSRLTFNILCGNTDDHARNHAAFWNGRELTLTPAYDICPQGRTGFEATQAMLISGDDRMSRISSCLSAAHHFQLSHEESLSVVTHQVKTIAENWEGICEEAELSDTDRALFWGRQFLNPYAFDDLDGDAAGLRRLHSQIFS